MKILLFFLLAFSVTQIAIAEPIYPDGRIGVKTDSYYAYRLMVPAGKPVQFKYGYSASKENRVMIHNMREDKPIPTIGNYNGDFTGKVTNIFSNPVDVEYLITGYSKNCRKASKKNNKI
ncbi:MAG: hypothetical protein D3918_15385, partial [Candidatus Electrothrix sp. AX2]|nr:hypothetical protein [Candidatus Electrothrix gigas]